MEQEKLEELIELTKENHKMLRSMQRTARINAFFRLAYWGVILASIFGVYYYVQPYIDPLLDIYRQGMSVIRDISGGGNGGPSSADIQSTIEAIGTLTQ